MVEVYQPGIQYIARPQPFYANIFFYIAILFFLVLIIYIIAYYINTSLKNRVGVRLHMPDGSLKVYWYKRGRLANTFKLLAIEKTQDGTDIFHTYFFRPECVEHGVWGDYIEYDYGHSEPINPRQRQKSESTWTHILRFVSGLLDTDLAIDLLLSQEFKDFVKSMLTFILIAVSIVAIISLIAVIKLFTMPSSSANVCTLALNNQTLEVIKLGVMMAK